MPYTPETDRYPRRQPAPPDPDRPPEYYTPDDDERPAEYPEPYDDAPEPPARMPDPPAESSQETAETHGGRVLAYVLEHGRPAVWRASDVAIERALSFSLYALAAPEMIERARDRIVQARRMMAAELEARRQKAARDARDAARLAAQPGPRTPFPAQPDAGQDGNDDDGGRGARLLPRPKINPPAGAMIRDLQF